ncbi:MAG: HAD family hydrolase [Armatimonadetes bacterium]|nr:HAD family hydrolase [Armatimonadota bacterium]
MKISGVFLDRDGVLNPHIPGGYLLSADELVVLPGVARAVRRLNDVGLLVIVISNQQGVGKGLMTMDDLIAIERRMEEALAQEAGARIDRCYYSTELASANSPRRKPGPGMLLEAARDFGLSLAETVFAGDSPTDIQAGHAAGVGATVLLLSGGTASYAAGDMTPAPDHVFPALPDAVDWILEHLA